MRHHRHSNLPLPPFGREVAQQRSHGTVNLFVFAGTGSWQRARRRPAGHRAAVPPGESWSHFDWSFVRGLGITLIVHGFSESDLCEFGAHLVRRGASTVAGLLVTDDQRLPSVSSYFFRPDTSVRRQHGCQ